MQRPFKEMALWGGPPLFAETLHVGRPNLLPKAEILAEITAAFDRLWLTNRGPCLQQFEAELCARLKVPHCILVSNATLALMILLKALDLQGEVIVPSFTFPATVHALDWQGLKPVFADIDPRSHTLDPAAVAALIGPQTAAIMGVHLWGGTCDIAALQSLADSHGLPLIFDAAHALACSYQGQWVGGFGTAEVFSFHATKFVHSLEGGAITTHSDELAQRLRQLLNFGYDSQASVQLPGINAKMHEVAAATGLHNLRSCEALVEINRERYRLYQQALAGLPGLQLFGFDGREAHNYQYVILEIDPATAGLNRDQLWQILQAEGVLARRYFYPPCHQTPPYQHLKVHLPVTETVSQRVLALPTGSSVTAADIARIGTLLADCLQQAEAIQAAWPELHG